MKYPNFGRVAVAAVALFSLGFLLLIGARTSLILTAHACPVPDPPPPKATPPPSIPTSALISAQDLAKLLSSPPSQRPLIIYVGFRFPYSQAHIPGSENFGPAADEANRQEMVKRLKELSRDSFIVIYCGCCPWSHCPNVRPAYEALHNQGFKKLKVLYIAENLGMDWVNKGYPVVKGE